MLYTKLDSVLDLVSSPCWALVFFLPCSLVNFALPAFIGDVHVPFAGELVVVQPAPLHLNGKYNDFPADSLFFEVLVNFPNSAPLLVVAVILIIQLNQKETRPFFESSQFPLKHMVHMKF